MTFVTPSRHDLVVIDGLGECGCGWRGLPVSVSRPPVPEHPVCPREVAEGTDVLFELELARPRMVRPERRAYVQQRVGSEPGRNEPCPCGSGRKFKRCCGG